MAPGYNARVFFSWGDAVLADLDLAALNFDLARLALRQRLGEAGLDVAEGHGVHGDVVAAELLGQRLAVDTERVRGQLQPDAGAVVKELGDIQRALVHVLGTGGQAIARGGIGVVPQVHELVGRVAVVRVDHREAGLE